MKNLQSVNRTLDDIDRTHPYLQRMFEAGIEVTFDSATEVVLPHSLGAIPSDIIVGLPSANAVIYRGTKAWSRSEISLKATAACSVKAYLVK